MAIEIAFFPFEEIPAEIIDIIFSFISCSITLGRLQRVCKLFHEKLTNDQNLWKTLCLQFWKEKKFDARVSLEAVLNNFHQLDSRKNWYWFVRCLSSENNEEGLSFRNFNTNNGKSLVSIGSMNKGKLQNNAVEIYLDGSTYYFGNFVDGKLHGNGTILWEGGAKYCGNWVHGHRDGFGTYKYSTGQNGDYYEGEFKHDGKKEGKGIFVYSDGDCFEGLYENDERQGWGKMLWKSSQFVYEGLFKQNEPADVISCLHPAIKDALDRKVCTGTVTGKSFQFGQFFYEHEFSEYCSSCIQSCPRNTSFQSKRKWSDGIHCSCVGSSDCKKLIPKKRKCE